jgi:hypothetical protein
LIKAMKCAVVSTTGEKRREIPDPQIKDAAYQYDQARRVLLAQGAGSGVLLPLLNCSTMAIELCLKSLSAEKVLVPVGRSGWSKVRANPKWGHGLKKLLRAIPNEYRKPLEREFHERLSIELKTALGNYEQLFEESRYPFERSVDVSRYPVGMLMMVSEFLCDYISRLTPIERIEGGKASRAYSPSDIQKFQAKKLALLEHLDKV